jgi:hypothetical protein
MRKKDLLELPQKIKVSVVKGKSGCLLAELPEFDVFTEADNLNHLFFQVNDLIYTYFNIPKKYQKEIYFRPPLAEQHRLIKIAEENNMLKTKFNVSACYSPELLNRTSACA